MLQSQLEPSAKKKVKRSKYFAQDVDPRQAEKDLAEKYEITKRRQKLAYKLNENQASSINKNKYKSNSILRDKSAADGLNNGPISGPINGF